MSMKLKPLALYRRVSRLGGRKDEGYISLDVQTEKASAVAGLFGRVIGQVYTDENLSGGSLDRPAFIEAMAAVRDGQAGGIVVATLDRFSRDVYDAMALIRELHEAGGVLICADLDEVVAPGMDDNALLILLVKLWQAQSERTRKADAFRDAVSRAINEGRHLHDTFGYRKQVNSKGARQSTALEPDPTQAPAVVAIMEMRSKSWSWSRICAAMDRMHPLADGHWTHGKVARIAANDVYIGTARWGDVVKPNAHKAIVAGDLFAKVQKAKGVKPKGTEEGYPLTGLVRCVNCSRVMRSTTSRGVRYYTCPAPGKMKGGDCPARTLIGADELDGLVRDWFVANFIDRTVVGGDDDATMEALEEAFGVADEHYRYVVKMAARAQGDEREIWQSELDDASAARTAARDQRDEHRARLDGFRMAEELDADGVESMSADELRALLAHAIEAIFVRKSDVWREPVSERIVAINAPGQTPAANLPGRRLKNVAPVAFRPPTGAGIAAA
jgi:site-specific DNA recombinase